MNTSMFSDDAGDNPEGNRQPVRSLNSLAMLLGIALLVIGIVWWVRTAMRSDQSGLIEVGQKLETIDLQPLLGATEPMQSNQLAGRVVLINFWGPWCGPCRMELPHLAKVSHRLQGHTDFLFLPVSCGSNSRFDDIEQLKLESQLFLDEERISLPVYSDIGATTRTSVMNLMDSQSFAYPTNVLLDREGNVRRIWKGYQIGMEKEVEQAVLTLLEG